MGLISWWRNRRKKEDITFKPNPKPIDKARIASCHCLCDLDVAADTIDDAIEIVSAIGVVATSDAVEEVASDVAGSVFDDDD